MRKRAVTAMDWGHISLGLSLRARLILALAVELAYMAGSRWAKVATPDLATAELYRTPMRLAAGAAIWFLAAEIVKARSRDREPLRDPLVVGALLIAIATPLLVGGLDVSDWDRWILVITSFPVAFHEEIAFRAVLQALLIRRFGMIPGIVLTSLCFELYHIGVMIPSFFNAAQAVLAGILLGVVFARTGSLLTVMTFHTLYDAFDVLPRLFPAPDRLWGLTLLGSATILVIAWYRRHQRPP